MIGRGINVGSSFSSLVNPVVIMRSKETDPLRWKVVYGFSRVFFRSLAEAVEFCNSRGFRLVKEQLESRKEISRDP